jgi:hypothetical protein
VTAATAALASASPATTQDQAALSHNAIKLAGTTDRFDSLRRFIAVR